MTTTNGHVPTLPELRESVRRERAAAALAKAKSERQLYESLDLGMDWSDLRNPWGYRYDGLGRAWMPLSQGGPSAKKDGRNEPFIQTDSDLDRMRAVGDWLTTKNELAIGATRTVRNLTVGRGYVWDARPTKGHEEYGRANDLARQVQKVITLDADLNKLPQRERSSCWRAVRDGEPFVRHFAQSDGTTRHRFVRAAQVRDPGHLGPCASFGVETDEDDVEDVRAYHVTYDGGSTYERVPAEQVSHLKRNVDEEIKRGLSDFFSAGEAFEDVAKLLRAMRKNGGILASMAYIAQHKNATNNQISAHVSGMRPLNLPQYDNPVTGRPQNYQAIQPGERVDIGQNTEFKEPPLASGTNNFVAIVQAALRAVGTRWGFPEYFVSGDASNNSYSSILVAGSPLVTGIQTDQDDLGIFFLRWRWQAVKNACRAGLIRATFEEVLALVDLHFEPPQVIVADPEAEARIDHLDIAAGVMGLPTRAAHRGLEWEQQRKEMKEFPATRVAGKATDLDAQGNPTTRRDGGQDAPEGKVASSSVGGLQAILALQTSVYKGEVPRLAAIANAEVVFGFSPAEAARLFPEVPPEKTADDGQDGGGAGGPVDSIGRKIGNRAAGMHGAGGAPPPSPFAESLPDADEERLDAWLLESGFSGRRTDSLGRARCYSAGKPVPCHTGEHAGGGSDRAHAVASERLRRLVDSPQSATPADVQKTSAALMRLTREEAKQLQAKYGLKAKGAAKQQTADGIAAEASRVVDERGRFAREARKAGVDEAAFFDAAEEVYAHAIEYQGAVRKMLAETKEMYKGENGKALTNLHPAFRGGDRTQINGFERIARTMAGRYPELLGAHGYGGGGDSSEAAQKLYDFLHAGVPKYRRADAYAEALDGLSRGGGRAPASRPSDEEIPF